jgi:hypothetical protein
MSLLILTFWKLPIKTHPKNRWVGGFLKKPTHLTNPGFSKLETKNSIEIHLQFK